MSPFYGSPVGCLYDSEGHRVAKGRVNVPDDTFDPCDMSANGFQMTTEYISGPNGEQLAGIDWSTGQANWVHTTPMPEANSWPPTLATTRVPAICPSRWRDWLGTRHLQTDALGNPEETCSGGSFGDALNCVPIGSASDASELHFTGKERDTESGLDYFGARYYGSNTGRFMSPDDGSDWDPSNPQSWNLYSYVRNNPLTNVDPDGHDCVYLNNAGNGAEEVDRQSSQTECMEDGTSKNPGTGGYWVDGTASSLGYDPNSNAVALTGVYNGQQTSSSYGFSDSVSVNGNSNSPQLNTVDISIGAMLPSPYPRICAFSFNRKSRTRSGRY